MALQDQHHLIAPADAELHVIGRHLIGLPLQVTEGGTHLLTPLTGPQQGQLVGPLLCPSIHDIVGKIEILGYDKLQMFLEILLRGEMSLLQKSFYHSLSLDWLIRILLQRSEPACRSGHACNEAV